MQAIEREILNNDWITIIFIFMLILLALMKLYKSSLLKGYTTSFFSQGFIKKRAEINPPFFSAFHGTIFLFSSFSISFAVFYLLKLNLVTEYIKVFTFLLIYMFIRNSFDFFLEKLIQTKQQTLYFRFSKIGYLYTAAILLFPVLIAYNYQFKHQLLLLIWIILLMGIRLYLIIYNNKKLIFNKFLYFILYICTLEITPLLIVYKLTTT